MSSRFCRRCNEIGWPLTDGRQKTSNAFTQPSPKVKKEQLTMTETEGTGSPEYERERVPEPALRGAGSFWECMQESIRRERSS